MSPPTPPRPSRRLRPAGIVALAVAACLAGVYFALHAPFAAKPPPVDGFFWPQQKQLGAFALVGDDAQTFTLDDLTGDWNLLFFGYTHCPDICPLTLATLRNADQRILEAAPHLRARVTFISVDAERDTPAHLKRYVNFFDPTFRAAGGDKAQIDSLTAQLGVAYQIEPHAEDAQDYLVAHSGAIFLITPDARLAAVFHAPHAAEKIADAYLQIRRFMEQA